MTRSVLTRTAVFLLFRAMLVAAYAIEGPSRLGTVRARAFLKDVSRSQLPQSQPYASADSGISGERVVDASSE
jgi:hypothetical protein